MLPEVSNPSHTIEWTKRLKALALGRSGLALGLWGEAGIGKTHAVAQLLSSLGFAHFSFHAAREPGQMLALLPKPPRLPIWVENAWSKNQQGHKLEPLLLQQTLAAVLTQLAPLVLHIEDLHEASPEQQGWMVGLAGLLGRSKGVGLIVTSRTLLPAPFEARRLEPLGLAAVQGLLEAELGSGLPPEAVGWIYSKAGGNPLFSLEYLRYLARQGFLWNDTKRWYWRSPPEGLMPITVEALLEQQLQSAAIEANSRAALEARAVLGLLGPEVDWAVWQHTAEESKAELEQAQRQLQTVGVMVGEGFAHPLLGEVAFKTLTHPRRQALARRAIQVLAPTQAAALVEVAKLEPNQTLALLKQAAEAAPDPKQKGDFLAQAAHYAQGPEQAQLALQAAQILQGHDLERSLLLGRMALEGSQTEALELVGLLLARKGDLAALEQLLQQHPSGLSQEVLRLRAYQMAGQHPKVVELWRASPSLQTTHEPDLLYAVTLAHLATGQNAVFQTLLALAQTLPLTPFERQNFSGLQAIHDLNSGRYPQAVEGFQATIEVLRSTPERHKLGAMLHNLSIVYKAMLEYPKAQQTLQESLEIRRSMGDMRPYANSLALMAEIQVELGQQTQAESALEEALGILQLQGVSQFYINTLSQASYLYSQSQSPMAPLLQLKHANLGQSLARQLQNKRLLQEILYDYSLAQTRNANPQQGLQAAEEMQQLATELDDPVIYRWRIRHAQAMAQEALGNRAAAQELLEGALQVAQAIPDLFNGQKLGLELDRLAGNALSAAQRLEWFESRGLLTAAALVRRYFPTLNGLPPNRVDRPPEETPNTKPNLSLEVLGPIRLAGQPLRGQKRKELLLRLLEARIAGRSEVSTLDLLEGLYPGDDETEAQTALKQMVFKIRSAYGQGVIQTTHSGYALGKLDSDAEAFLQTAEVGLWRGLYAEGLEGLGSVPETLYARLRQALQGLADPAQLQALSQLLLQADPYDLEALQLLCRSLQDQPKTLGREYAKARERLAEVGEALPESYLEFSR